MVARASESDPVSKRSVLGDKPVQHQSFYPWGKLSPREAQAHSLKQDPRLPLIPEPVSPEILVLGGKATGEMECLIRKIRKYLSKTFEHYIGKYVTAGYKTEVSPVGPLMA